MISFDLLQALLSPIASQRVAAEAQLLELTVEQRCEGLLQAFQQMHTNTNGSSTSSVSAPAPTQLLAAVLLRREIIHLSDASQLLSMIDPLLQVFSGSSSSSSNSNTGINHCLAELCASLPWLDRSTSIAAVQRILQVRRFGSSFVELVLQYEKLGGTC